MIASILLIGLTIIAIIIGTVIFKIHRNKSKQYLTPAMQAQLAQGHAMMKKVGNWNLDVLAGAGALRSNRPCI